MNVVKLMEHSGKDTDEDFWWLFDDMLNRIKKTYRES
jgi:hypothetical protein